MLEEVLFSLPLVVFHRTQIGNQSDQWLNGQVTLRSSSYYRLQIEAIIGK